MESENSIHWTVAKLIHQTSHVEHKQLVEHVATLGSLSQICSTGSFGKSCLTHNNKNREF